MLKFEEMKQQASKYMLAFVEDENQVFLLKSKGELKLSYQRALEWIAAGIEDIDCKSSDRMIQIINQWMEVDNG